MKKKCNNEELKKKKINSSIWLTMHEPHDNLFVAYEMRARVSFMYFLLYLLWLNTFVSLIYFVVSFLFLILICIIDNTPNEFNIYVTILKYHSIRCLWKLVPNTSRMCESFTLKWKSLLFYDAMKASILFIWISN